MRLYYFPRSGNSYKVRLLLAQLGIAYESVGVDLLNGANRRPDFLEKNPNGRVPLLEIESGQYLAESSAILFYLSEGTRFQPKDRWEKAKMMQWLFFEQYEIEPNIATSRYWISILGRADEFREPLQEKEKLGYRALTVMENHLWDHTYFAGESYSIADIALFAYTHVAHEGRFSLEGFPSILKWLDRVRAQPGYIGIAESALNCS
jgi:glutathione S-transferase